MSPKSLAKRFFDCWSLFSNAGKAAAEVMAMEQENEKCGLIDEWWVSPEANVKP
jgi:hypothetical protein